MIVLFLIILVAILCSYTLATWYFMLMVLFLFFIRGYGFVSGIGIFDFFFTDIVPILYIFNQNVAFRLVLIYLINIK